MKKLKLIASYVRLITCLFLHRKFGKIKKHLINFKQAKHVILWSTPSARYFKKHVRHAILWRKPRAPITSFYEARQARQFFEAR